MKFEDYPFEKLNRLLSGIEPDSSYPAISLTIGEPQFETPKFIQDELANSANLLNKYPKSAGEDYLKEAMLYYNRERFSLSLQKDELIPVFGTRELLFNFPQFLLFDKKEPTMAFPNPFYQIYEGAAIASRAKIVHLNLEPKNNFLPILDKDILKDCDLVILNTPNNPTASVMSQEDMIEWVEAALEYDFVLLNDECYIELYTKEPIPSILQASIEAGNREFKNILTANSLSKRSSAPGLRSGYIAGDKNILKEYMRYRTYVGCASPLPLQRASAIAWKELSHVEIFREAYRKNFEIAREVLGIEIPKATFYIWLDVGDDIEFTKELYKTYNIKVLPGSYLGREGIGKGYVRVALVYDEDTTKDSLTKIARLLGR